MIPMAISPVPQFGDKNNYYLGFNNNFSEAFSVTDNGNTDPSQDGRVNLEDESRDSPRKEYNPSDILTLSLPPDIFKLIDQEAEAESPLIQSKELKNNRKTRKFSSEVIPEAYNLSQRLVEVDDKNRASYRLNDSLNAFTAHTHPNIHIISDENNGQDYEKSVKISNEDERPVLQQESQDVVSNEDVFALNEQSNASVY